MADLKTDIEEGLRYCNGTRECNCLSYQHVLEGIRKVLCGAETPMLVQAHTCFGPPGACPATIVWITKEAEDWYCLDFYLRDAGTKLDDWRLIYQRGGTRQNFLSLVAPSGSCQPD